MRKMLRKSSILIKRLQNNCQSLRHLSNMGGFEFGSVTGLNSQITLITFIAVIAFVVFFDFIIGLMEYFLEGSQLYNRMIQMIYKELMLMGLVSFTVIMIEAGQKVKDETDQTYHEWILGIDFSHILLFYLTLFFVAHSFYLMRQSFLGSSGYRRMFCENTADLITELESLEEKPREKFLFGLQYLPLSDLRDRAEFHLMHSLFKDTYWLPEDFNFASYLSGCFDRYALKTINRSMFTWFVLMLLGILNFCRIEAGYGFDSCMVVATESSGHRRLNSWELLADDPHTAAPTSENHNETSTHGDDDHHAVAMMEGICYRTYVKFFVFCALVLCLYTFFIVFISRVYKLRLINRIGFTGPQDYVDFLRFAEYEEHPAEEGKRVTTAELKVEINNVLDADEHHNEEEEEFREVGEFLIKVSQYISDVWSETTLALKVLFVSYLWPSRVTKSDNAPSLLSLKTLRDREMEEGTASSNRDLSGNNKADMSASSSAAGGEDGKEDLSGDNDDNASVASEGGHHDARKKVMSRLTSSIKSKSTRFRHSMTNGGIKSPKGTQSPKNSDQQHPLTPNKIDQNRLAAAVNASNSDSGPMISMRKPASSRPSILGTRTPSHPPAGGGDHSILNVLANIKATGADEDNKLLVSNEHYPVNKRASFVKRISAENLGTTPNSEIDSPSSPTLHNRGNRRNSVHVKPPDNVLSTIEKFHKDHPPKSHENSFMGYNNSFMGQNRSSSMLDADKLHAAAAKNKQQNQRTGLLATCCIQASNCISAVNSYLTCCRSNKVKQHSEDGKGVLTQSADTHESHDSHDRMSNDFQDIYLFRKPLWFFRAVELCIMFNCLYLALWVTNFIKIAADLHISTTWHVISQICMAIPFLVVIPCIGYIAKTSSQITAISELNLEVVQAVLIETEDVTVLLDELRAKMLERIGSVETAQVGKMQIIHGLFNEIDQDGSGSIDKLEFRVLLRHLKLTYSDQRFKRLYRAVDSDGDNNIKRAELDQFLNPEEFKASEAARKAAMRLSLRLKAGGTAGTVAPNAVVEEDGSVTNTYCFDSDGKVLSGGPAAGSGGYRTNAERLRALSSISDYSDTDSEGEGGTGHKKHRKSALEKVDSLSLLVDGEKDDSGVISPGGSSVDGRDDKSNQGEDDSPV